MRQSRTRCTSIYDLALKYITPNTTLACKRFQSLANLFMLRLKEWKISSIVLEISGGDAPNEQSIYLEKTEGTEFG